MKHSLIFIHAGFRLTRTQAKEILKAISVLPPERVAEVQDFIFSLKARYGHDQPIDKSETCTDEDIHDLTVAVLNHASHAL